MLRTPLTPSSTPITPVEETISATAPAAKTATAISSVVTVSPLIATATTAPTPPPGPLSGEELVDELRSGGYVIYFRHGATIPSPDDANPVTLEDCKTQRNLSVEGQAQAREIGQAFRQLEIPAGKVFASPFCRALDTARLAFERVEIEPVLENLETSLDEIERETRIAGLRHLLATPPDPGTNTILTGHGFNINAASQITIGEGEAAIFRPGSDGDFMLVATVPSDEWSALDK